MNMWGFVMSFLLAPIVTQAETRDIIFPVIGDTHYSDDYGDPRDSGNRVHEGNDIFGTKGQQLVAAVDGTVRFVPYPEPDYGYYVSLRGDDGFTYVYIHLNNDSPGTDDGQGGGIQAYAPYMESGNPVVAGQLIGWMGDSGNAEGTSPHLHFEIRDSEGDPINPFESLNAATHVASTTAAAQLAEELLPFGEFTGGASIALGNFDQDEALEIVTGAGPGGGPNVRVMDQDEHPLVGFFAYDNHFSGGVDVAAGDVDGDGIDEIITSAGAGGGPQVRVFNSKGKALRTWYAYDQSFKGGVYVTATDINGDGKDEIITGPGEGGRPQVRVFNLDGRPLYQFLAYDSTFTGGVDVAARPATADQKARIITAPGPGGSPEIRVFRADGGLVNKFFAYDTGFSGGVRVDVANIDTDTNATEIVTIPASQGSAHVRLFNLRGTFLHSESEFEEWWTGGFDVAAASETVFISSGQGGRRASAREVNSTFF